MKDFRTFALYKCVTATRSILSLSADGKRVAIGAVNDDGPSTDIYHNIGNVRVFDRTVGILQRV